MRGDLIDQTDPFAEWQRAKHLKKIEQHRPSRTKARLIERPPTHVLVNGEVAVVVEHLGDCLWHVTIHQQPIVVHELDTTFLSRDWLLHQA